MHNPVQPGTDVLLPELGVVYVLEVFPHGGAVVIDNLGRRWLLTRDLMVDAELCLFTDRPTYLNCD